MKQLRSSKIKKFKNIVLYGAGNFANQIKEDLLRNNFIVDFCVVTRKDEKQKFLGETPIYSFDEKITEIRNESTAVIIAVSKDYETEILFNLENHKIQNVIFIDDLYRDDNITLSSYVGKSEEEYIDDIAEWYVEQYQQEVYEFEKIKSFLMRKVYQQEKINKKITIIAGDVSPRMIKIVKALYEQGYCIVVLICPGAILRSVCISELQKLHILCFKCNFVEELMYHLILERGQIIHFFSCWLNSIVAYALIRMKSLFSPVVYDEYDIINEMYVDMRQDWLIAERFCLEHADGICNRGWEMDYFINRKHYPIKGKVLHFLDYCRDGKNLYQVKKEEEPLSICYVGGIITKKEGQTSSMACWMELAELCEKNQCNIHVYPSVWDEEKYKNYMELDKNNPYFHFHRPVQFEQLELELSQYDYGIFPTKKDFLKYEKNGCYYSRIFIYTCINKYFDYLDAGLPIIGSAPVNLTKYFEAEGICLRWSLEEIDFNWLRVHRNELKRKVEVVREKLQIKNHIDELIQFYCSLS